MPGTEQDNYWKVGLEYRLTDDPDGRPHFTTIEVSKIYDLQTANAVAAVDLADELGSTTFQIIHAIVEGKEGAFR